MKIAFSVKPLQNENKNRGTGSYTYNLLEELRKIKDIQIMEFTDKVPPDYDAVHYPFFDPFFLTLPLRKNKPTIVTVHDLIPLVFPDKFPRGVRGEVKWQIQRASLKTCNAIITDSINSKKDIVKYTGFPEKKIFSIPLAAGKNSKKISDVNILKTIKAKYNLPEKFVLYVGDVNWNKNVTGLLKAYEIFKQETKLVLVGSSFLNTELTEVKGLKLPGEVVKLGFVPDIDLVGIYNLASCYVQPSYYEGFGLPVLDALACECPVACSNTSSLPEVGGSDVLYFNPYDIEDIADKIRQSINTTKKTSVQNKIFSWEKTVNKTIQVYKKVLC